MASGDAKRFVFGFQVGVEADGDEGRHVERLPQGGPSAADEALAAMLARVAGDRREASEACCASLIEVAAVADFTAMPMARMMHLGCPLAAFRAVGFKNLDRARTEISKRGWAATNPNGAGTLA